MHNSAGIHENVLGSVRRAWDNIALVPLKLMGLYSLLANTCVQILLDSNMELRSGKIPCTVHVEETPFFWTKTHSVSFNGKIHIVNLLSPIPGKGINLFHSKWMYFWEPTRLASRFIFQF